MTPEYIYILVYTLIKEKSARPVPNFALFLIFPHHGNPRFSHVPGSAYFERAESRCAIPVKMNESMK